MTGAVQPLKKKKEKKKPDDGEKLAPWWEQMREYEEPGQVLRLKVVTGMQRRSMHIMFGPQGVPSST